MDLYLKNVRKDLIIIQGDWHTKIKTDGYQPWHGTVYKFRVGMTNARSLRLLKYIHSY